MLTQAENFLPVWPRLRCHRLAAKQVRLWPSVIAYNLGNLGGRRYRSGIDSWSLTNLQQPWVKTLGRFDRVFGVPQVAVDRESSDALALWKPAEDGNAASQTV